MPQTCKRPARQDGREKLFALMVEEARFRDRRSFGSDGNHAAQLGVSRRTIIRWRQQLEDEGRIIRCGWHRWAMGKRTVMYRFCDGPPQKESCGSTGTSEPVRRRPFANNVTQRLRRVNPTPSGLGTSVCVRTNAFGRATKRGEMSEIDRRNDRMMESFHHPPAKQPTAQDVVATVCDTFAAKGIPLPSRHKGIIARQAKELLGDGFDYETVVIASVIALRRAQPQNLHFVAADLVMARAGERMTRREYEKALQDEMELR